jgi:hypothetical protein
LRPGSEDDIGIVRNIVVEDCGHRREHLLSVAVRGCAENAVPVPVCFPPPGCPQLGDKSPELTLVGVGPTARREQSQLRTIEYFFVGT